MRSIDLDPALINSKPSLAYVIDPRFPGGTSSALSVELPVMARFFRVTVHAVETSMFSGRTVAPQLQDALDALGLVVQWDEAQIGADVIVLHNPSFLKFETRLGKHLVCNHLIVVPHENFYRPGGAPSFDVDACMSCISKSSLALHRSLAPISDWNRETVVRWLTEEERSQSWQITDWNWFNICSFDMQPPTRVPKDRRGRHSRPGPEKFPLVEDMDKCFPPGAEANVILGADGLARHAMDRPHWQCLRFGEIDVPAFFDLIDFAVYFTSQSFRESFGRVLAESIAAGKLVISDPKTAAAFGKGVIGARPEDVDGMIAKFVADPDAYAAQVLTAQNSLADFSPERFESAVIAPLLAHRDRAA